MMDPPQAHGKRPATAGSKDGQAHKMHVRAATPRAAATPVRIRLMDHSIFRVIISSHQVNKSADGPSSDAAGTPLSPQRDVPRYASSGLPKLCEQSWSVRDRAGVEGPRQERERAYRDDATTFRVPTPTPHS
jgi:hypothetical protein